MSVEKAHDARADLAGLDALANADLDDSPDRYGFPFEWRGIEWRPVPLTWLAHGRSAGSSTACSGWRPAARSTSVSG